MSFALEPAIWSWDSGQRMPCFDSCQLTMIWQLTKANVQARSIIWWTGKQQVPCCPLHLYAHAMHPQTNATARDDHEKRDACVSYFYAWFSSVCSISIGMGLRCCGPSGRQSSAITLIHKARTLNKALVIVLISMGFSTTNVLHCTALHCTALHCKLCFPRVFKNWC